MGEAIDKDGGRLLLLQSRRMEGDIDHLNKRAGLVCFVCVWGGVRTGRAGGRAKKGKKEKKSAKKKAAANSAQGKKQRREAGR